MRRALVVAAAVLVVLAGASLRLTPPAQALSTQVVSCAHLHLAYSFAAPPATDTPYGVSVFSSQCTNGAGVSTAADGSGTVTFLSLADNSTCVGSLEIVCARLALNLSTGSSPTFTTEGALYYPLIASPVPSGTLDIATVETITGFSSGHGAGALNTLCTFSNATESCTADGSLVWEPGL